MKKKNFYISFGIFLIIVIAVFFSVSAYNDNRYNDISKFGHSNEEVLGVWDELYDGEVYNYSGSVGIGTSNPKTTLDVLGDVMIGGQGNGIIIGGVKQTSAINDLDHYYCPPRQIAWNIRLNEQNEIVFHQGCKEENYGKGDVAVRIISPIICTERYSICYPFAYEENEKSLDNLCKIFGFPGHLASQGTFSTVTFTSGWAIKILERRVLDENYLTIDEGNFPASFSNNKVEEIVCRT